VRATVSSGEAVQERGEQRAVGPEPPGAPLFKPLGQVIESVDETFKGQLGLEQHRGRTPGGVVARVMRRILALTAAIWHNDHTGQLVMRSLAAYDHRPLGIDHLALCSWT
jgi:hypothetical protein